MKKYAYIDAVRGIATLAVLVVHCHIFGTNSYPFVVGNVMSHGAMGVQLFYIASAFTLFLSLSNRTKVEHNGHFNFFIRRVFRIAPLYYLAIVYYLYQDGLGPRYWLGDKPGITTDNILSNFFFVHGFNPYWINAIVPGGWSISVEMLFYLMVPFLFRRIHNINDALRFLFLTLVCKAVLDIVLSNVILISDAQLWNSYLNFYLVAQLPVFACGFILFFMVSDPGSLSQVDLKQVYKVALAFTAGLLIGFNFGHIVFGLAFTVLIWGFSKYELSLFSNRFTRYVGKVSYSMYLLHFAILHWMGKWHLLDLLPTGNVAFSLANYAVRYTILVILTLIASTVTYHLIEQPFQKLGKYIIKCKEGKSLLA
jgi:peptidoglycan/LPS O-acetylase OafA/YrhL